MISKAVSSSDERVIDLLEQLGIKIRGMNIKKVSLIFAVDEPVRVETVGYSSLDVSSEPVVIPKTFMWIETTTCGDKDQG